MQLNQHSNPSTSNIASKVQFGISKNSTKLFSMLSTSLYSNKELAVLFEIGANCSDAHALNGNQYKPWDLICPTSLDPTIRFRDYGPGLSEDQVYSLLTTYGESTKANSNEFIGAYGIGSKSPAAVTSNWTVISRFEGVLTEYLVFIDQNGVPSLSKIREDLDDVSGLEVIIPVTLNRFYLWTDKIKVAYANYKVRPNVINYVPSYPENTSVASGENWNLHGAVSYGNQIKFITTQREYSFSDNVKHEFEKEDFMKLLSTSISVHFPIGTLETSLSREDIQYTRHTIENIRKTMRQVFADVRAEIDTILAPSTDRFQFCENVYLAANKFFGSDGGILQILQIASPNTFGIVNRENLRNYELKLQNFEKECKPKIFNGISSVNALTNRSTCFKSFNIMMDKTHGLIDNFTVKLSMSAIGRIVIVINDSKNTIAKVKYNLKGKYALISDKNVFPEELQRLVILSSSLALAPKEVKVKVKRVKPAYDMWEIRKNSFGRVDYNTLTDMSHPYVAVSFTDSFKTSSMSTLHYKLWQALKDDSSLNIVARKEGADLPKNVVDIEEYANNYVATHNTDAFFIEHNAYNLINQIDYDYSFAVNRLKSSSICTTGNSKWNELQQMIKTARSTAPKDSEISTKIYNTLLRICTILGVAPKTQQSSMTLDQIKNSLYTTYPMLKYVNRDVDMTALESYLNLTGK